MDEEEAAKILGNLSEAAAAAVWALRQFPEQRSKIAKAVSKIIDLQDELKSLKEELRKSRMLLRGYEEKSNVKIELCPGCNGTGGHEDFGPCEECDERGWRVRAKDVP